MRVTKSLRSWPSRAVGAPEPCPACARNLDHCHGSLVVHLDGGVDCTQPGCDDVDKARHTLVIDCDDTMFDGCGCLRHTPRAALRVS